MSLRTDLIPCIDDARQVIEDLDLRVHLVVIRTRTWDGPQRGEGAKSDADLTISPRPLVSYPSPRLIAARPGKFEKGDRVVSKITRTLAESDMDDSGLSGVQERFVLINGDEFRVVGRVEVHNFEYKLQVRRMRKRVA